jgi:hypothetical protein
MLRLPPRILHLTSSSGYLASLLHFKAGLTTTAEAQHHLDPVTNTLLLSNPSL